MFIRVEQSCPIEWYWVQNTEVIQFEENSALSSARYSELFCNFGCFALALKLWLLRRVFQIQSIASSKLRTENDRFVPPVKNLI